MTGSVSFRGAVRIALAGLATTLLLSAQVEISAQQNDAASAGHSAATSSQREFLDRYCATCHNERLKTGGLSLERVDVSRPDAQPELWEKVVRKLHTGVMPPANMPQPPKADRLALLTWLETSLDAASVAKPNPGRTETLRRLNRTEYQNAIRDLLALDVETWLVDHYAQILLFPLAALAVALLVRGREDIAATICRTCDVLPARKSCGLSSLRCRR